MKNNIIKLLFLIFFVSLPISFSQAEKIKFEALEINTIEEGNIIIGKGNAKTVINNKIYIDSDEIIFNKEDKTLKAKGNIKVIEKEKNLEITSDKLRYNEFNELITAEQNVVVKDTEKEITIRSNHIQYFIVKDEIFSKNVTKIDVDKKYKIKTADLKFENKKKLLFSDKKTFVEDIDKNFIELDNFYYSHFESKIIGKNIKISDYLGNNYFVNDGFININEKKLLGKDIQVNLDKSTFENSQNDPRLKGNFVVYGENKTLIKKGVFTSCKINENCPPWHITSNEIIHYKDKNEIHYKNAWLNIYDRPVLYFPKFFHPDPSVKRKSGFLTPRISNNNNLGTSITTPYFKALSESSDFTVTPKIFSHKEYLIQNEYREVTKNSSHTLDFSLNKNKNDNKNGRKTHFFSNSSIKNINSYFDESNLNLKIEKTSNDNYIKEYSLETNSPILKDTEVLESALELSASKNNLDLVVSIESYETMNKSNNDRYEFVYPNYSLSKLISMNKSFLENIDLRSSGSQKKFSTNIYEGVQVNDMIFSSNEFKSKFGINHKVKSILKNINSEGKKSSKYKNELQSEILNLSTYDISLPLIKKNDNYFDYLTPKLSIRHSPNDTKNISNNSTLLNAGNVFSFNRIGQDDNIEGGSSLTVGLDYEKKKNNNTADTFFKHRFATVFRNEIDENLPEKSTLGEKQSDLIGEASFYPNDIISFNYDYLIDKNVNQINLHNIKNTIKINNFISNFKFYEENNIVGKESYYESSLGYSFDERNFIKFSTRENKKDNLTEFYDLIYEYKNDCLTASIKYNKKYYSNSYLKPSEDLFFTITIIPLGSTQTESILD